MEKKNDTMYIDINEIQSNILPLGKRKIRQIVKDNIRTIRCGNKILVNREDLINYISNLETKNFD